VIETPRIQFLTVHVDQAYSTKSQINIVRLPYSIDNSSSRLFQNLNFRFCGGAVIYRGSAFQCWSADREPGAECTDEWGSALELSQPANPLGVRAGKWHLCLQLRSEFRGQGEGINFEIFVAVKEISAKKLCCNLAD
jgi:hypothetical protein